MIDPEITQLKARMTLIENMWIENERKLDILIKKIDGFTDLIQRNPKLIE